jgi:hypothetical protein
VYGATVGSVEFFGSGGAYAKVDLVEGTNVRDHYQGSYNNVIDGIHAVPAFAGPNGARLDQQIFDLPASFAGATLQTIRSTNGGLSNPAVSPFIAGATVAAVPEPAGVWLLAAGGALFALRLRRR